MKATADKKKKRSLLHWKLRQKFSLKLKKNKTFLQTTFIRGSKPYFQSCFQNPHESIGQKISQRACDKRNGFANFYVKLSSDEKDELMEGIKVLLEKAVANINFLDEVCYNNLFKNYYTICFFFCQNCQLSKLKPQQLN